MLNHRIEMANAITDQAFGIARCLGGLASCPHGHPSFCFTKVNLDLGIWEMMNFLRFGRVSVDNRFCNGIVMVII